MARFGTDLIRSWPVCSTRSVTRKTPVHVCRPVRSAGVKVCWARVEGGNAFLFFYLAFQFGQRPCPEVSPSVISPSQSLLCHATTSDPASASSCLVSGRGVALLPPSNCASLVLWLVFVKVPRPPAVLSVIGRVAESDKGRRGRVICPIACTYYTPCSPITRLYLRYGPCLIRHHHITWSYGPIPAPIHPTSRSNR